jgi:hypothetical protein
MGQLHTLISFLILPFNGGLKVVYKVELTSLKSLYHTPVNATYPEVLHFSGDIDVQLQPIASKKNIYFTLPVISYNDIKK